MQASRVRLARLDRAAVVAAEPKDRLIAILARWATKPAAELRVDPVARAAAVEKGALAVVVAARALAWSCSTQT
jgi:hypothetical protein